MTTSTTQTLTDLRAGSIIADRYEITHKLGMGGFATVFAAFDREIERTVAIKVLNLAAMSNQSNEDVQPFLERFRREARLAARIRHPNVVEIYDFGVLGGNSHPYMIMEMLDGYDLADELKKTGALKAERALPLFCGALEALGEAHQLGIIHKDLKPANLFINRPGTRFEVLKVVDFGIAHIGDSNESRMTQTGAMFGTPQYLSPEYVQTQVVTPAMDVYQMGLILVEMLTGVQVVNEDNPWQCAVKHVTRDINMPVALLDGALGPIVKRALEYAAQDRYPTAAEFADELSKIDPAAVGDLSAPEQAWRKIDSTSGQFTPGWQSNPMGGSPNTDAMRATPPDEVPAARIGLGPQVKLQTAMMPAPLDPLDTEPTSSSRGRTMMFVVLLLLGAVGAGGAVFALMGSTDPAGNKASTEVAQEVPQKQNDAPIKPAEPVVDKVDEALAGTPPQLDNADDQPVPGAAVLADSQPDEALPGAQGSATKPASAGAAAATAEKTDKAEKAAPAEAAAKSSKEPSKEPNVVINRKPESAPAIPAATAKTVKLKPAQPAAEQPAEKATKRPGGMRLVPDIKKKDDGIRVAP